MKATVTFPLYFVDADVVFTLSYFVFYLICKQIAVTTMLTFHCSRSADIFVHDMIIRASQLFRFKLDSHSAIESHSYLH